MFYPTPWRGLFGHTPHAIGDIFLLSPPPPYRWIAHVPQEFGAWVDEEVSALEGKGYIVRWSEVVDASAHPKPNVTLLVGVELTKPWFSCGTRYLDLMCEHSRFKMDGVGKITHCLSQGAHPVFNDHKSGLYNVPLRPYLWAWSRT